MLGSSDLLEDDFREPFTAWKAAPGPLTNGPMLKALHPTIEGAIRTHVGEPNPLLMSRARLMTLEGLGSYDPKRGRLQTHLYNHLQGLKRVNRQQATILKVPERISLDRYHLENATQELSHQLGREPTDSELADHVGMSLKRIAHVRRLKPSVAEGGLATLEDGMSTPYAPAVDLRGREHSLYEFLYHGADPVDQLIMEHTLGLHGKPRLQNQQLAAKLRLSPGAVSQRKARLQAALHSLSDTLAF